MAGLGYKDFTAGAVLTAAQVDGYLMEQAVMNFAGTAARGSALSSVQAAGMMAHVGGGTVTVYDGSAWQQVYPAQAGLVFVAGTAFSAVSSVSVNNCFTSTYANYLLKITGSASGANVNLQMRLRASGSDDTNATYNVQALDADSATVSAGRSTSQTLWTVGLSWASAVASNTQELSIFRPNESETTTFLTTYTTPLNTGFVALRGGYFNNTTSFDGFSLLVNTGTITGTVRVYGYRNS